MYTMMQVCQETSMTYQTLKYYCNEGLVPNVKRDKNNRRIFDERDIKCDQGPYLLEKMRHEHPGDENLSGFMPSGRIHNSCKAGDSFPQTGSSPGFYHRAE